MKKLVFGILAVLGAAVAAHAAPLKIGEEVFKSTETPHPYALGSRAQAEVVWKETINHPGATYIAPHFSRFHLAEGDYLIIRSPDGTQAFKYEGLGRGNLGATEGFWGVHITGDTAELELYSVNPSGKFGFVMDRYARGYRPEEMEEIQAQENPFGPEALCGADDANWAKCYTVTEPVIYDKARAVARLIINGSGGCTGWLIGNGGHLMTNHHCITNASDAANTDYEFMAEGATCATSCTSFGGCPGTIEAITAVLVATDVNLDYSLVLLPTNITPTYGFLKLRTTLPSIDERIYLPGHPQAWGKRIAVTSTHASDPSGFCEVLSLNEPVCIGGATPEVGYACDTQPGSSGSPMIAYSDHKVVALHHCSNNAASCPANRGLRIPEIITSLGPNLPPSAITELAGRVELDKNRYGCSATIGIHVKDDSIQGAGTQNVTIASTTESTPETVVLTENPANSGDFYGSIPATTAPASNGDGALSVAHGDTITVTYIDADDGQGGINVPRTDTAAVDCVDPVISNVQHSNVTGSSAKITWDTNEPADSTVHYGLLIPPSSTTSSGTLVVSHSMDVTGLDECSTYYYSVESDDEAGNSALDDNSGAYYTFETGKNVTLTYTATDTPVGIPDNTTVTSQITVTDANTVVDVNVQIDITHTYDADLDIFLIGPNGTRVELSTDNGADGNNFTNTIFDDEAATSVTAGAAPFAGSFRPETPLSALDGILSNGTWTLEVSDDAGVDVGTINSFKVILSYPPQACGPSLAYQAHSYSDTCHSTEAGGDAIADPGEDLTVPVQLKNNGTDPTTGITADVSTTTPGVTVAGGPVAYPDLDPGESAYGASSFVVSISPSVPCGTVINLQVAATANEGSWNGSFSILVGFPGSATNTYNSTDVPKPINDLSTVTSTLSVSDTSQVLDVNVGLTLTHTFDGDLDIFLVGPNGTRVELSTDNGGTGENFTGTVFDDEAATSITAGTPPYAGSFRPEGPLSALDGIPANGTWTLEITDDAGIDTGTLLSWNVVLTTVTPPVCDNCTPLAPQMEVLNIIWSDLESFGWDASPGASYYNVYRGDPPSLPDLLDGDPDSCKRASPATNSVSGITEAAGGGTYYWYIVRSANAGGEGPVAAGQSQESTGACP